MNPLKKIIMIALVVLIVVSFFMPWVRVESPLTGGVTKILTGKEQSVIDQVSGMDVPLMANSSESRFMISVIKIFNPGIKDADKKSWLILGVPGLSIVILLVSWFLDKNKWVNLGFGILGCAIFGVAVFKLMTTDLDKLVLKVSIAHGLWLLLLGYLGRHAKVS